MTTPYRPDFFKLLDEGAERSARQILPGVIETLHPAAVVDVGCGTGAWLQVAQDLGVGVIVGIDGDYVGPDLRRIPSESFLARDLTSPIDVEDRFDLAICLEVAEHLEETHADRLVADLVRLAPVVLFSAAIPGQGGEHHVNEQWQDYWARRFVEHGRAVVDVLRRPHWDAADVWPWYLQNTLLFVDRQWWRHHPDLPWDEYQGDLRGLRLVHPQVYETALERARADGRAEAGAVAKGPPPLRQVVAMLPGAFRRAVSRRLRKGDA